MSGEYTPMNSLMRYGAAIVLVGAGISVSPLHGCTCAEPPAMKAAQDAVDVVFRGTLTGRALSIRRDAIFRVEQVWKGRVGDKFRVEWKLEDGDCSGFRSEALKVGTELLVFATRGSDGVYRTNICYPTTPVADAAAELAELGAGERPSRR